MAEPPAEEKPLRNQLWRGGTSPCYSFKDDMEFFSSLMVVHPIIPSLDKLWDPIERESADKKPSLLLFPSSSCDLLSLRRLPMIFKFLIETWFNSQTETEGVPQVPCVSAQPDLPQGSSFSIQLFQCTLDKTLGTFEKSMHEDMRNLHIEILKQVHIQEMDAFTALSLVLQNQVELMKEYSPFRKKTSSSGSFCNIDN